MNKGEATRQRIIATAAPIFNQRGYAGTCMQDILAATELEKGGLYRHFSGKEELALESFRHTLGQLVDTRIAHLDTVDGAALQLLHLVDRFVRIPSPIAGGCPLMNVAADADEAIPALLTLAGEGLKAWQARLMRILRQGIRTGELRSGLDPRSTANTIIAMLEGALMITRLEGNRRALHEIQASLIPYIEALKA